MAMLPPLSSFTSSPLRPPPLAPLFTLPEPVAVTTPAFDRQKFETINSKISTVTIEIMKTLLSVDLGKTVNEEKINTLKAHLINIQKLFTEKAEAESIPDCPCHSTINEISSLIVRANDIQRLRYRQTEFPSTHIDHKLYQLGLDARILQFIVDSSNLIAKVQPNDTHIASSFGPVYYTQSLGEDNSEFDELQMKINHFGHQISQNRIQAAKQLDKFGDQLVELALKADSESLKKFIVENKLDLNLIQLSDTLKKKFLYHFSSFVFMHFCHAPELTEEHYKTVEVLMNAGCDFRELFNTTAAFDLFGFFKANKLASAPMENLRQKYLYVTSTFGEVSAHINDKHAASLIRFINKKDESLIPDISFNDYYYPYIPPHTMLAYLDLGLKDIKFRFENADAFSLAIAAGKHDQWGIPVIKDVSGESYQKAHEAYSLRDEYKALANVPRTEFELLVQQIFNQMHLIVHNSHGIFPSSLVKVITDYIPNNQQAIAQIWRDLIAYDEANAKSKPSKKAASSTATAAAAPLPLQPFPSIFAANDNGYFNMGADDNDENTDDS